MLENKNFKNLLSLLNDEIELQGSTHISITYKKFHQILDDDGIEDFLKYLEYFQRKKYLKITGIKQFNSKILSLSDYNTLCHFNDLRLFNEGPTTINKYVPIFPLEKDIFYFECNEKKITQAINRNEEATIRNKAKKDRQKGEINYSYNKNEGKGTLQIGSYPKIEFSKMPALIIKYFSNSKNLDNNYKSYQDFLKTYPFDEITSDYFSKKIKCINDRLNKETERQIKQVISKDEKRVATEINRFRWEIKT
jgi:hypothetical protein